MRPCNQCRQPIENNLQLCEACQDYNKERGIKAKPSVSIKPFDPSTQKPVPFDQTINTIMISFMVCSVVFFGLLGWQLYGVRGFVAGVALGVLSSGVIPATLR